MIHIIYYIVAAITMIATNIIAILGSKIYKDDFINVYPIYIMITLGSIIIGIMWFILLPATIILTLPGYIIHKVLNKDK